MKTNFKVSYDFCLAFPGIPYNTIALWDKGISYIISSFYFLTLAKVSELILMKTGIKVSIYMQELEGKTWPKSKEVYG